VTRFPSRFAIALIVVGGAWPAAAVAGNAQLTRAVDQRVAEVDTQASLAAGRSPTSVQALYDVARDLEEAARASVPVSRECRALLSAALGYSRGRVREAEGVDRPSSAITAAGRRAANASKRRISRTRGRCRGRAQGRTGRSVVISPGSEEAFYGPIVVRAPSRAQIARLLVSGRSVVTRQVRNGRARFILDAPPGRYDLRIQFRRGNRTVGGAGSKGVWLLPASARKVVPATVIDAAASRAAAAALRPGPRFGAAWVQSLSTGAAGAANAGARFPAASTVKLGMLASGLPRLGPRPQRSPHYYDMRAMTRWSSNLATNRLLNRLGGSAFVERGLRRLGARESTFTGGYVVGTALQPRLPLTGVDVQPPLVSRRVTTAQDLGHMMFSFAAAAAGNAKARRATGLTRQQARLGLGWLLGSEQRLENASLLAGGVARRMPIAQKNGWLRAARHGAGVIFTRTGPKIAVILTYDAGGVSTTAGRAAGARVARVAVGL